MTRFHSISLATLACVALVPAFASAQIKKQANGAYLMRIKYTKGEVIKQAIDTVVTGLPPGSPGADANGRQHLQVMTNTKIVSVSNGNATMLVSVQQIVLNGHATKQTSAPRSITMDTRGQPVGGSTTQNGATKLPENAVKVGQTWSGPLPVGNGMSGGGTATYKFLGIKNVDGKQVAVLSLKISTPQIKSGGGTLYLFASNGETYKTNLSLSTVNPQTKSPITVTISSHRV